MHLLLAYAVITVDMVISCQANISDLYRIYHPNYFFAYQEILNAFLSSDFFQNQLFSKNSYRNTNRVSNSSYPDQARHLVGPDLGSNCLQMLSADDASRQRVKSSV